MDSSKWLLSKIALGTVIFKKSKIGNRRFLVLEALVYQHGNTPDHFFQTYIWSKRGVDLGDSSQSRMMALGIDRYLVNIGQKQLFGTQATKLDSEVCWCIQQVETSFPDELRKRYAGKSYAEALAWLKILNAEKNCPNKECTQELKPSPQGTVPGLW